ncbi:MAG TPA: cupin domain-containing protein [Gammaproteobacteria bacterium]|nr:cupin domain-containing protein [Gammaproteobacteria bacterium]
MSTATRAAAVPTVQVDNDAVKVTEWRFAPDAETGWHRHEYDYVVVPVTDGRLRLETPNGEIEAELKLGQSYSRSVGVEHNVINASGHELVFVEVEIKR